MARRRITKKIPFEDETIVFESPDGKKHTIECTEGSYTEETVELNAAEAVLLDQLVKDWLRKALQPQKVQEAQGTGEPLTDEQRRSTVEAAHEAAAAIDSFLQEPGIAEAVAQQEELQRLMQLPLSQIEQLPKEKQELVWDEMARRIVETPDFVDGMNALAEMGRRAAAAMDEWEPRLRQMAESATRTISGISAAMESIRKGVANLLSDDTIEAMKTWGTLAPYIEAEAEAHPEKYGKQATEPASATELIAAAARRAREDGKEIPPLRAEEPEQLQFELPTEKETDKEETPQPAEAPAEPSPLSLARKAGTITSLGDHVATIADKMLQYCFTSRDLKGLPGEHDNFLFDSAGKLNEFSLNGQPLQPLDDIHTGFLMALLQMANICDIREYNSKDNPSLGVYLPAFFREAHIDPRPREWDKQTKAVKKRQRADDQTIKQERLQRFIEFMKPLDNRVGIIQGEGYYTVARFLSWDEATDTAFIAIPFEIKLAEIARLHADRHSAISTIFRADILTENQAAVELANRIAVGLIERGVTTADRSTYQNDRPRKPIKKKTTKTAPDGTKTVEELTFAPEPETTVTKTRTDENGVTTTVTGTPQKKKTYSYRVRFSTLIADCPQLQRELAEIRNSSSADKSQRINKKLKNTFTAAIRIIMEKSDIPKYYAGVEVKTAPFETFKAPTNSTVNSSDLVITHKGKNPAFAG